MKLIYPEIFNLPSIITVKTGESMAQPVPLLKACKYTGTLVYRVKTSIFSDIATRKIRFINGKITTIIGCD